MASTRRACQTVTLPSWAYPAIMIGIGVVVPVVINSSLDSDRP